MVDLFFFIFVMRIYLLFLRIYFCEKENLKERELYNEYNNVVVVISGPSTLSQRKAE